MTLANPNGKLLQHTTTTSKCTLFPVFTSYMNPHVVFSVVVWRYGCCYAAVNIAFMPSNTLCDACKIEDQITIPFRTIDVKLECKSGAEVIFYWLCLYECACLLASMAIRNGTIVIWLELSLWALMPRNCVPQSANKAKIQLNRLHLDWMQFFSWNIIVSI